MYNRVLTSTEITKNFNAYATKFGLSTIGSESVSSTSANITINSVKGVNISGVISGAGQITKVGADSLLLTGVNTTTGALNVNAGTVKLGATNVINDSADVYFNGGNLSTGYNEVIRRI
jgi:autotransporter-associated beta strand protein